MKVSEIFFSIDGEGIRTGAPAVFIRLHGCNLRCSYCDSMYAVEGSDFTEMNVGQIADKVKSFDCKNVTLTGGEPLIHQDVQTLLQVLDDNSFDINIETNGTMPKPLGFKNVFVTMDWKCSSSNMQGKMKLDNFRNLDSRDVVKFVVGSVKDLEDAARIVESLENICHPTFYVSPVFGTLPYQDMVNWILSNQVMRKNLVRFQVQLHKVIWDPNERGV